MNSLSIKSPILWIIGMPFLCMGLSYSLFFLNQQKQVDILKFTGVDVVGSLLKPALESKMLTLINMDGEPLSVPIKSGQWTLVLLPHTIEQPSNLHQSQQMHIALGKYANRLQRIQLVSNQYTDHIDIQSIKKDHPKLVIASISNNSFINTHMDNMEYFLIDPRGWIMMSYPDNVDEKNIMTDLKHLFKYSR